MFSDSMMLGGGRKAAFSIAHSVRLDGVADYFTRTPTLAGNQKTWTFSCWVKRSSLVDGSYTLLNAGTSSAAFTGFSWDNGTYANHLTFYCNGTGANLRCSMLSRDVAAWYHLCLAVDTDLPDAQASDRVRIYVNGQRVTAFDLANYPARSTATHVNAAEPHQIGKRIGTSEYLDGYVTQPILVDGAALDPTSFGETDPVTGSWRPKRYVGPGNLPVHGADVTAGKTVSLSPDLVIDGTNLAPFAIDNNPSTKIATNNAFTANTSRIIIDLGAGGDKAIARITTNQESNYVWTAGKLQYSDDGTSWSDAGSFNPSNSTSTQVFDFPDGGAHRYWALMPTANAYGGSGYGLRFNEIELIERLDSASNFGTNGFHLDFADADNLGSDVSSNANHWIPVSLGAADVVSDTPTNNYATWNPLGSQDSGLAYANGNRTVSGAPPESGARATIAIPEGGWYWEETLDSIAGARVFFGLAVESCNLSSSPDAASGLWGIDNVINKYDSGTQSSSWASGIPAGSRVGVAVTRSGTSYKLWFRVNGGAWLGSGDPGVGANPTNTFGTSEAVHPIVRKTNATAFQVTANWGQVAFVDTPPAGFKSLCTANLPTPVIQAPAKHMDVVTYTGNGTARAISGLGFRPDLVWVKNRDLAYNGGIYDSVRGSGKTLIPAETGAERTDSTELTSFDDNGFSLGTGSTNFTNRNGEKHVAWCWKAGGAAVANTDGTIASLVSANPTAGFSVVAYTGDGAGAASFGHGLGAVPKMVIIKSRGEVRDWPVYHAGLTSAANILYLNSTLAQFALRSFNDTAPTSTVVNIHWNSGVNHTNKSGDTFVAYCWAEVPGFSKFGSYIGNGSTDGPFVHCGFRPAFVLIKRTSGSEDWSIHDSARDIANPVIKDLFPNTANAELVPAPSSYAEIDFTASGFKLRNVNNRMNASGETYIYAAFAEAPFGGAKTVPAKAR